MATSKSDKFIQENYPGDPIDEDECNRLIEEFSGKCECGGVTLLMCLKGVQNADQLKANLIQMAGL